MCQSTVNRLLSVFFICNGYLTVSTQAVQAGISKRAQMCSNAHCPLNASVGPLGTSQRTPPSRVSLFLPLNTYNHVICRLLICKHIWSRWLLTKTLSLPIRSQLSSWFLHAKIIVGVRMARMKHMVNILLKCRQGFVCHQCDRI